MGDGWERDHQVGLVLAVVSHRKIPHHAAIRTAKRRERGVPTASAAEQFLFRAFGENPLASTVIQVDELIRRGNVTDNAELADGFMLGGLNCGFSCLKTPAVARILRPLACLG